MTQITSNYANQFEIDRTQESIDFTSYYFKMARQLGTVAEHYNRSLSEDIYMGYSELATMIESLAMLYKKDVNDAEIVEAKDTIYREFNSLIMDLENYFDSYPDEISQRDIVNGKLLATNFSQHS